MISLKLVFESLKGCCRLNQLLLDLSTEVHRIYISVVLSTELISWMQAASGAAGRANIGLCSESSYKRTKHLVLVDDVEGSLGVDASERDEDT